MEEEYAMVMAVSNLSPVVVIYTHVRAHIRTHAITHASTHTRTYKDIASLSPVSGNVHVHM
jgi:hypothetical protein